MTHIMGSIRRLMTVESTVPPQQPPLLEARARRTGQALCALGVVGWTVVFGWLWLGAPLIGKLLGAAWFALGLFWPTGYLFSLALALPLFGNNPGGPHHLYLLEMGLMGLVSGDLIGRLRGLVQSRRHRLDPWIVLLVLFSWLTLFPTLRWIRCELLFEKHRFMYRIFNHYGTAYVFGMQCALKLTLAAGLYFALRDRPWPPRRLLTLGWVLIAALTASALVGLFDYFNVISLRWWRGQNPDIVQFGWPRLQSLYWHSGWYAQYLAALAPGAMALGLAARSRAARWTGWSLVALLGLTQLLTQQRGGWLALGAGLVAVLGLATLTNQGIGKRWIYLLAWRLGLFAILALALTAVLALTNDALRNRLGELGNLEDRTRIWHSAWGIVTSHPITGSGLGYYYRRHEDIYPPGHPYWKLDKVAAHSLYLHTWAERGLIGLALLLVVLGGAWAASIRAVHRAGDDPGFANPDRRVSALAVWGGLTALAVYGIFQYLFYIRTVSLLFWCLVAWAGWLGGRERKPLSRRWITIAGLWLLVAAGLVMWGNRHVFIPWKLYLYDREFIMGPQEVELEIPAGAVHVRLPLSTYSPDVDKYPVTYTISLAGRELKKVTFDKYEQRIVELELPRSRPPDKPLTVRASHTWSPWAHGLRQYPLLEQGVLYLPLERTD